MDLVGRRDWFHSVLCNQTIMIENSSLMHKRSIQEADNSGEEATLVFRSLCFHVFMSSG